MNTKLFENIQRLRRLQNITAMLINAMETDRLEESCIYAGKALAECGGVTLFTEIRDRLLDEVVPARRQ